jgi:hypothetical protein
MKSNPTYDTAVYAYTDYPDTQPRTDEGIIYQVAGPEHRQGVLEVLARAFVNEPSTAGQSISRPTYDDWYRFTDFYMDECTPNGLSIVAL